MNFDRNLVRRLGSSTFNYWFGYVANFSLVAWLLSHNWQGGHAMVRGPLFAAYALTGWLTWTLAEYLLHRYVYHVWPSFLSTGHDLHHKEPKELIGVPWYLTAALVVLIYTGLARLFNPGSVAVIFAFAWLGYIGYCLAHHGSHHWAMRNPILRKLKRHHQVHHAHPAFNWGFTTDLWDVVFGTHWERSPSGKAAQGVMQRS